MSGEYEIYKMQLQILQEDKENLVEHIKNIRATHKEEIKELRGEIKKKRRKLKKSRDYNREEIQELRQVVKQRENTIQELLTLRMFLRSSIEWIKQSVSEGFPNYNSFLYTAMFSNFGLVTTKGFYDFLLENVEGKQPASAYWVPYLAWFILGAIGWLIDRHVSKNNALEKKLNAVQDATFGAISQEEMRNAIGGGTIEATLTKKIEHKLLSPLGTMKDMPQIDILEKQKHISEENEYMPESEEYILTSSYSM